MTPIEKAASKVVNHYVELFDGDWKEVRKEVRRDIDLLLGHGGSGARLYAVALDAVYHELAPKVGQ